jgi:hypothetical protein
MIRYFTPSMQELFYINEVNPGQKYPLKIGPILNGYEAKGI